ncbi:MAG TPA: hypothetical protein VGY54_20080, partial [Polyangiaceae bacterium]|nr:hypothetical protein [Polyangiaceae bacterium]
MPRSEGRAGKNPPALPLSANDEAEVERTSGEMGSIDQLLAASDQAWDVDDQVRTLEQVSGVEKRPSGRPSKGPPPLPGKGPPPLPPGVRSLESSHPLPSALRMVPESLRTEALIDLLQARVATLEAKGDVVGVARAHLELAIASETILGDDARAATHSQAALRANPQLAPAHAILRRVNHGRPFLSTMLEHLEHEILAAATEAQRSVLLAEKARLIGALGGRSGEARLAWEQALGHTPNDAAALKGLEEQLTARALASGGPRDWDALAGHLGRMAEAYATDVALAAWLHVERARILERKLERIDAARSALERALELDPRVGPVRTALVQHVAAHGDWGRLAQMLEDEAQLESNGSRAARLELDAALIVAWRLGERRRACTLLERAAARAPTAPSIDRRVLDELVRLNEIDSQWADAARARRARLSFVKDAATAAYELRVLATIAERNGNLETAIGDLQQSLVLDASDPGLVQTL